MRKRRSILTAMLGVMIVIGCSSPFANRLKHFFFEIPPQSGPPPEVIHDAPALAVRSPIEESSSWPAPARSIHPPFARRQCLSCHDPAERMHVREDRMSACRDCHARYFGDEVGHPPVRRQQCDKCHVPHAGDQLALLRISLFETCMQCHKPPEELSPEDHERRDVRNCTLCHDPHFGQGFRLKSGAPVG